MLDFYHINDNEEVLEYPDEERFIGHIDFEDFQVIYNSIAELNKQYSLNINYYSDFRINSTYLQLIVKRMKKDSIELNDKHKTRSFECFVRFIEIAISKDNTGIVCYCD